MNRSNRIRLGMLATFCLSMLSGCSMCCQPYLEDYAAFGSRTPRADRVNGRVGSPFSDPAFSVSSIESVPEIEILEDPVSSVSYEEIDEDEVVVSSVYEID